MARQTYIPVPPQKSGGGTIVLLLAVIVMILVCIYGAPMVERYKPGQGPAQPQWYLDLGKKLHSVKLPSIPAAYAAEIDPSKLVATTVAHVTTNTATGDMSIYGAPTLTPAQINALLAAYNSPASGVGQDIYNLGLLYGIDPAFALAFFQHESSWGLAGMARVTHSPGNLRCLSNLPCYQGYASFGNWTTGFQQWYALLAGPVYKGSGLTTVATIIPKYAPPLDNNDDQTYIASVLASVQQFRNGVQG